MTVCVCSYWSVRVPAIVWSMRIWVSVVFMSRASSPMVIMTHRFSVVIASIMSTVWFAVAMSTVAVWL